MNDKTLVERLREHVFYGDARLFNFKKHSPLAMEAADTIEAQATRIEALEAALRFYARENSWKSCGVYMSGQSQPSSAEVDRGNKARKALESQP